MAGATIRYLTDAVLFAPAADKWAKDTGLMNSNGSLLVLKPGNNLSDINDANAARINLGVRIGVDVQPFSSTLAVWANAPAPSTFTQSLLDKSSAEEWAEIIGTGSVRSVAMTGGNTGLIFTGGPITSTGTFTLGGVLAVSSGGTGVTSVNALRTLLDITNIDNTADTSKPISIATQAALNSKYDRPTGDTTQYIRGDGTLGTLPNAGAGSVTSVAMSGGTSGLSFTGGPITSTGTFTLTGTLSVANGGTGVTSLSLLKTAMGLDNVNNTSDLNKPVSTATQTQITNLTNQITALTNRLAQAEYELTLPFTTLRSAIDGKILTSSLTGEPLTSALDYLTSPIPIGGNPANDDILLSAIDGTPLLSAIDGLALLTAA